MQAVVQELEVILSYLRAVAYLGGKGGWEGYISYRMFGHAPPSFLKFKKKRLKSTDKLCPTSLQHNIYTCATTTHFKFESRK